MDEADSEPWNPVCDQRVSVERVFYRGPGLDETTGSHRILGIRRTSSSWLVEKSIPASIWRFHPISPSVKLDADQPRISATALRPQEGSSSRGYEIEQKIRPHAEMTSWAGFQPSSSSVTSMRYPDGSLTRKYRCPFVSSSRSTISSPFETAFP